MRRRSFLLTTGAAALGWAVGGGRTSVAPRGGRHHGVSFDAFRTNPGVRDFEALRHLGATHVALTPFGWMRSHRDPQVFRARRTGVRSRRDDRLIRLLRLARDARLEVLIVPTIANFRDGHWRGDIRMDDEPSWRAWFASYRSFVLHYADVAATEGVAGVSVGSELNGTVARETQWRETVALVRDRFDGWLTYGANWDAYGQVAWWDSVDFVGVQAYFELGDPPAHLNPWERRDYLTAAWMPIKESLAAVSRRSDRPVLFTEIGYRSQRGATARPWRWNVDSTQDLALQADAYEAAFRAVWEEPWFAGMYWWKWRPDDRLRRNYERDFTPQGKPAERVLRRWWAGE